MTTNTYTGYRRPTAHAAPTYSPRPSVAARLGGMLRVLRLGFTRSSAMRLDDHLASDMGLAPSHKELPAVRPYWRL